MKSATVRFSEGFILLFLCPRPRPSPAPDRPAGLVVAPFPSPAARHSRSRVAQRGWTEGNLEDKEGKEGHSEDERVQLLCAVPGVKLK